MFWPLHLCSELKHPVTSCVNYQLHHKSLFQTKIFLVTPFFGSPAATFCSKNRFLAVTPPLHLSNLRYNHIFFNKIKPLSMRNNLGVKKKVTLAFVVKIDRIKWKKSNFDCYTSVTPIEYASHPHFFPSKHASTYEK